MLSSATLYQDLILVGGGHSHALVLKMWAMKPLPGVRLTLISPQSLTPYSGMLPGLIADHYDFEQTHIDLARLCQFAGARFFCEQVTNIDLDRKQLLLGNGNRLGFDLLSINTGITPDLRIHGDIESLTPVKPIATFYPRWQNLIETLKQSPADSACQNISVVGAGAAGIELVLAMQYRLQNHSDIKCPLTFSLIHRGEQYLERYPTLLRQKIRDTFNLRKIEVINNFTASNITKLADKRLLLESAEGEVQNLDHIFWCTAARAAAWPAQSGLATESGFIAINDHLQSISHSFVFAAGDVALQQDTNTPRAGVYAVRQGKVLFENLQRKLLQKKLLNYRPQKTFLSLLACGDRSALGCRPGSIFPTLSGGWVWRWKDRIDRKFMNMFHQLPAMKPGNKVIAEVNPAISTHTGIDNLSDAAMRCGGCGAKVGANILSRVIRSLQPVEQRGLLLGLHSGDDASAFIVPEGKVLVQSVDVFRALLGPLDDPFVLGQIAAEHALSDLFAMNAKPHSAQAIVTLPYASDAIVERDLGQLMNGAVSVLNKHGCALSGGHTSEGAELSIGFSVNGLADLGSILTKAQVKTGHTLILTQALGTGCLFAAHAQLKSRGVWLGEARRGMVKSNRQAASIFFAHNASACTDITGFGLAGHLLEMLKLNDFSALIELSKLPALAGALECLNAGIVSTLHGQNAHAESEIESILELQHHPRYPLLFDPQTSGGLLASVPENQTDQCLEELRAAGYEDAVVIGHIVEADSDTAIAAETCSLRKRILISD